MELTDPLLNVYLYIFSKKLFMNRASKNRAFTMFYRKLIGPANDRISRLSVSTTLLTLIGHQSSTKYLLVKDIAI